MKVLLALVTCWFLVGCVSKQTPHSLSSQQAKAHARIALAVGYLKQGNFDKARANIDKAVEHAPSYFHTQLTQAHYFELVGEVDKAKQLYQDAIADHPNNGDVLNNYAAFLCKQQNYLQADKYFNQAIAQPQYTHLADSYENAGLCALKAQQLSSATYYLERALDYRPNSEKSLLQLTQIHLSQQSCFQAQSLLTRYQQLYGATSSALALSDALASECH